MKKIIMNNCFFSEEKENHVFPVSLFSHFPSKKGSSWYLFTLAYLCRSGMEVLPVD